MSDAIEFKIQLEGKSVTMLTSMKTKIRKVMLYLCSKKYFLMISNLLIKLL